MVLQIVIRTLFSIKKESLKIIASSHLITKRWIFRENNHNIRYHQLFSFVVNYAGNGLIAYKLTQYIVIG